jgi:transcriptional regulator with XRE-family HTH domain
MTRKFDLSDLVKNARKIRGLSQERFAAELGKRQSLVSKYERGLVEPPGEVVIHCVTITRGEAEQAVSPDSVANLVRERLAEPEFARLRAAIALLIESVPRHSRRRGKSVR